jgi:hypothetical protein
MTEPKVGDLVKITRGERVRIGRVELGRGYEDPTGLYVEGWTVHSDRNVVEILESADLLPTKRGVYIPACRRDKPHEAYIFRLHGDYGRDENGSRARWSYIAEPDQSDREVRAFIEKHWKPWGGLVELVPKDGE